MVALSRLEEIRDLRTVWPHEALDFTPWLAQDENMALLSDAIEIDMTVDEIESCVGDFNVDIFASETGTLREYPEPVAELRNTPAPPTTSPKPVSEPRSKVWAAAMFSFQ